MSDPTKDPEATNPGLTVEDGVITIGPAASEFSRKKAEQEAFENADRVTSEIDDEAASGRKPGSPAGSDQPDSKKNAGA